MTRWEYLSVRSTSSLRHPDRVGTEHWSTLQADKWIWDRTMLISWGGAPSATFTQSAGDGDYIPDPKNPGGFTDTVPSLFDHLGSLGWELVTSTTNSLRLAPNMDTGGGTTATTSHPMAWDYIFKRPVESPQ